ncbi:MULTISPECIES: hypothetical protein [Legionella]|uniref:Coiled-coil protein n=1 Tax=Legionella resiliens TaxID=2905958 RepID=A0ABS8X6M8_9GAMM|nr:MULTISPECIES: hypothetical protein [unclassified Legionella]MCE0724435.1 hypothetical protein [Legionella sp. 9fVS26]MCE3533587.1 hypothetical protein [Legionella sp. 8cVS16]QLZ69777.1 hypothetical protein FOLKNPGA_02576 [Legionella sp. PC1000]
MSKFPLKTPAELRRYFNQQSLDKLIEINHSYEPHFVSLDNRVDELKKVLNEAGTRRAYFIGRQKAHLKTYEATAIHEESYQSTRNEVLMETNQTDRNLGLKAMGISPMEMYEYEERSISEEISKTSDEIKRANDAILVLEQKKRTAVSELRILNDVIKEKRQPMPGPTMNQLGF